MRLSAEDLPVYDPGPFQPGEEKEIADCVEQFLLEPPGPNRGRKEILDYRPSDAPPGLVRRFLIQKPDAGESESWIPWRELPDDLYWRVWAADECKQKIYQVHIQHEAMKTRLTVDEVQAIYAQEQEHSSVIFELSDVYICFEADVLRDYENRDHPDPSKLISKPAATFTDEDFAMAQRVYQATADWSRGVLEIVGQALRR